VRSIAITGGPGAGKTSVVAALSAAFPEVLVSVPEVATLLLRHVFPPVQSLAERRAFQRAIFEVQRSLEDVYRARLTPGQVLLCDRGTPDGGGYWPEGHHAFFHALDTDHHRELARYDAVLFLETAAAGGHAIHHGNEVRSEDLAAAVSVDRRLFDVWSEHAAVEFVAQTERFADKVARGVAVVEHWLTRR
jgi:predicted ATPase